MHTTQKQQKRSSSYNLTFTYNFNFYPLHNADWWTFYWNSENSSSQKKLRTIKRDSSLSFFPISWVFFNFWAKFYNFNVMWFLHSYVRLSTTFLFGHRWRCVAWRFLRCIHWSSIIGELGDSTEIGEKIETKKIAQALVMQKHTKTKITRFL